MKRSENGARLNALLKPETAGTVSRGKYLLTDEEVSLGATEIT